MVVSTCTIYTAPSREYQRMRPFLGQFGTTPSCPMPDSPNAGDFGSFLVGAPHSYALTAEHKPDGHMDIDAVRPGATPY